MLQNILNPALQNIAKLVYSIDLHILIVAQAIELGAVHIIVSIEVILRDPFFLHSFPQAVICDQNISLPNLDFLLLSP